MTPEAKHPSYPPKELSDQALAWIVRLHSGEAGKADWSAFRAWRGQSADHEAAALEAETLWSDVSELHRDPATGLIQPGRRRRGPSRRAVLGGIAGLAAAGAAAVWVKGASRAWQSDHATGVAETRTVTLADGSRVTLNAMTAIDVDYGPDRRRIVLVEGQAFFEVTSDHARPFTVETGGNRVQALGTAFDVDANLPDGSVAVAVTQHSVRVEARASSESASLPATASSWRKASGWSSPATAVSAALPGRRPRWRRRGRPACMWPRSGGWTRSSPPSAPIMRAGSSCRARA